jgi:hypothetical protein
MVDGTGNHFLAGAAFTGHQRAGAFGLLKQLHLLENGCKLLTIADDSGIAPAIRILIGDDFQLTGQVRRGAFSLFTFLNGFFKCDVSLLQSPCQTADAQVCVHSRVYFGFGKWFA